MFKKCYDLNILEEPNKSTAFDTDSRFNCSVLKCLK